MKKVNQALFLVSAVVLMVMGIGGMNKMNRISDELRQKIVIVSDVDKITVDENLFFINGNTLSATDTFFLKRFSYRSIRTISFSQYDKHSKVRKLSYDCLVLECADEGSYMEALSNERNRSIERLIDMILWSYAGLINLVLLVILVVVAWVKLIKI